MKQGFDKKYNSNGAIFTVDSNPFEDMETTIYGHNMKTGLMFSDLGKYLDKYFLDNHMDFDIYTKTQNYKATVFSCYSIDNKKEKENLKSLDDNGIIEYYKNASKYKIENTNEMKKIVKLSTCSYIDNHTVPTSQRYFIVAELEKIQ